MRDVWSAEFARLGLLLVLALVLGALFDATWVALALALGGYLGWHLRNLWRLEHWLSRQRRAMPPESDGIWGAVLDHYWRIRRRDRSRKRRLAEVLRAVREANAAMPDGTVLLDAQFEIAWCNSAAEQLLGLRLKADRGQHVANLVRNPQLTRLLRSPPPREPIEMESPADARRWLQIFLVDYGVDQHLLLVQDATRVHRLEQMRRQSDRMTGIVNDLLELSRLETESEEPGYEPVDVRGLLARIREEALALGEGPRDLELQLESPLRLGGVERELYSAFSNLVFNAMRYTAPGGRVQVRWAEEGGAPVFSVQDTGIGIAAEHIPRLTERFYRVDSSRTRARGGTGLGLAIVKHVVQRHGGRLLISSTPGEGSRFTCVFPPNRAQR
jgi:two-component system phosphate regulon sensor histidine kinase PhoR